MRKTNISILETIAPSRIATATGSEIAVIIPAPRGRTNKVYTIYSADEFSRIYGDVTDPTEDGYNEGRYCKYLLNRGHILRVIRGAVAGAKASVTFYKDGADSGTAGLTLTAVSAGDAYNGVAGDDTTTPPTPWTGFSARITYLDASLFALEILDGESVVESFNRVSLNPANEYYWANIDSDIVDISITGALEDGDSLFDIVSHEYSYRKVLSGGTVTAATTDEDLYNAAGYLKNRDIQFAVLLVPCKTVADTLGADGIVTELLAYKQDTLFIADLEAVSVSGAKSEVGTVDSEYACVAYPKVRTSGLGVNTPASIAYADLIASRLERNNFTTAPAGVNNPLPGTVDVAADLTDAEITDLQEACINPIIVKTGVGVVVWGENTLAKNLLEIQSVGVRLMVNYLKRNIYNISMGFMFTANNQFTWNDWTNSVEPLVRDLASIGAILDYRVECGETTMTPEDIANGILRGTVIIRPVSYITDIKISIVVDEAGVNFEG